MRILITGGAGYIGTILVPMLLERGHHVTVLDTFKSGGPDLSSACQYDTFEPIKGDARDTRILDDLIPKHDVLIPSRPWSAHPCARRTRSAPRP